MARTNITDPAKATLKRKARNSINPGPQKRGSRMVKRFANKTGFSDLPLKAKNLVYSYCLAQSSPIRCVAALEESTQDLDFNILYTCKAIAREAKEILYAGNTFRIDLVNVPGTPHAAHFNDIEKYNSTPFQNFMSRIGQKNLGKIRTLVLAFHDVEADGGMRFEDLDLPEKADYAVEVKLVAKKPFCELSDYYLEETDERRKKILADFKQGILTHGMLSDWRPAPLSKVDAVEMCREYFLACTMNLGR